MLSTFETSHFFFIEIFPQFVFNKTEVKAKHYPNVQLPEPLSIAWKPSLLHAALHKKRQLARKVIGFVWLVEICLVSRNMSG